MADVSVADTVSHTTVGDTRSGDGDKSTERVSMFNCLSPQLSFAVVVGEKNNSGLEFFPLSDRKANSITIPIELAREAAKEYHTTVVGYFLGYRVPFPVVQHCLRTAWGKYGFNDVMMNNNGFFFIKFNDEGGSTRAIEEGMLMIRNVPMCVGPWDPSKGLSRPSHDSCPLWVKFHNVPLVLFNKEGISHIASALGVPKCMDACTASMCDKKWGRSGFAKVLIDVWATGELKKELEVVIPHLHDEGVDTIKIGVEYVWEPNQCSLCCVFGHKQSSCVKVARVQKSDQKKPKLDDDGFVRGERKQWRRKETVITQATNDKEASSSGTKEVAAHEMDTLQHELSTGVQGESVMNADDALISSEAPMIVEPVVIEESDNRELEKAKERKRLGLEFVMPVPSVIVDDKEVSPTHQPQNVVLPKAPIKGILKNSSRVAMGGVVRKDGRDNRDDSGNKAKDLGEKGGKGLHGKENSSRVQPSVGIGKSGTISNIHNWSCSVMALVIQSFFSVTGTGIILSWNSREVDIMALETTNQFMHCEVKIRKSGVGFFALFVYGANREGDRAALRSGLRKFKAILGAKPWTILGDINAMLFPHDALGGCSTRNAAMASFFSCIEDIEVFDARYSGIQFTWCQKPADEGGLKRKLDRVLVNSEFVALYPDSGARFFPWGISDHSPAMLSFKADFRLWGVPFKFDNFLTDHPLFSQTVAVAWSMQIEGTFMYRVTQKLKELKNPLRKLRGTYGNLAKRSADLKHELEVAQLACDLDSYCVDLREDLAALRVAYINACKDQESALQQRAKVKWMRDGDANTKFFNHVVREKRHLNQVHSIARADGTYVYDEEVLDAFVDHFKSFMGTPDHNVSSENMIDIGVTSMSVSVANDMIRPISDEEIRVAMFGIGNDKAPGSDGFSSKFFKAAWGIVGNDVMVAIHNFFYRVVLQRSLIIHCYQCMNEAVEFGFHHGCEPIGITHICFADDLFVFTRGDVASVEVLKKALSVFASCSGLSPSLEKSESLQLYWMGVFLLPSVVVHELEGIFRDFLWTHGMSSRGKCRVAWADVCKPKECGGLGLRRLVTWNRALVSRNLWDIVASRDTMWTRWVKRYYIQSLDICSCTKKPKWSWVFRKMMDIRGIVRRFVRWRVGDGLDIHAWEDHWLPCGPLNRFISYRSIHASGFHANMSVNEFIQSTDGVWPEEWSSRYPQIVSCVIPSLQVSVKDVILWEDGSHRTLRACETKNWTGEGPMGVSHGVRVDVGVGSRGEGEFPEAVLA
ncbi:hypothetical protein OSB04_006617 [Centaurea solstitialis]|uniref:DUF4283 domain-containing protein n=1 Tax=Centaurea solstitialis TaxID=347529 RepID=A0AA38WHN1_9ASTR|nr:hypothetical protein OSB04_006617 [Centaurea solstitialis]